MKPTTTQIGACTLAALLALTLGCTGPGRVSRLDYQAGAFYPTTQPIDPAMSGPHFGPGDRFSKVADNPWISTSWTGGDASTFAIDVDTASYTTTRAHLRQGSLPDPRSVRIEEMLNYFPYSYEKPAPDSEHPIRMSADFSDCPWNPGTRLARVTISAADMDDRQRPPSNLVFLVDVSGSMQAPNKLGFVKQAFRQLCSRLDGRDRVALVVYAGAAGLVLDSTSGHQHGAIMQAIDRLQAGGSTAGGEGIRLAYATAQRHFIPGGNNRVILATDGDFNIGITNPRHLVDLVRQQSAGGIDLTVLGVGRGNLNDHLIEEITNKGNGTYHYIDTIVEAHKVFGEDIAGNMVTIARDVKAQIFFNPRQVAFWRQIGYSNRQLARQDFDDDRIDAGEIGVGHTVTALYEIQLHHPSTRAPHDNPFVAQEAIPHQQSEAALRLRLRYRPRQGGSSRLMEQDIRDAGYGLSEADADMRWAVSVAAWGELLRGGRQLGRFSWNDLARLAETGRGTDPGGYRHEAIQLMARSAQLYGQAFHPQLGKHWQQPQLAP
jgi:Ca-activated chloride channel family protein